MKKNEEKNLEVLLTRYDGQIYGIKKEDDGFFLSVVPSDLAEQGYGFPHSTRADAENYLKEVIAECEKPMDVDEILASMAKIAEEYGGRDIGDLMLKLHHNVSLQKKNLERYDHLRRTGGAIWFASGTNDLALDARYDEYVDLCIKATAGKTGKKK